jgi:hypothetical protein
MGLIRLHFKLSYLTGGRKKELGFYPLPYSLIQIKLENGAAPDHFTFFASLHEYI